MYNTKQISTHPFCRIARIEKSCYIFHYDPSFTISIVMQTLPTQPVALQLWTHTNRFTFAQKLPANCKHASECFGEMLQYYPFHRNQTLKHNKHYIPNALDCPFAVSSLHIRIGELKKGTIKLICSVSFRSHQSRIFAQLFRAILMVQWPGK